MSEEEKKERKRKYNREWYERNKERLNAAKRTEEYKATRRATRDLSKDRERWATYSQKNQARLRAKAMEYNHRPEVLARVKEYRKNAHLVEKQGGYQKRVKDLSDKYIKGILVADSKVLTFKDIPQDLVEIKRLQIRIRRMYLANTTAVERTKLSKQKQHRPEGVSQ